MCAYVDIYFLNRPILRRSCLRLHSGCRCPYISRWYFLTQTSHKPTRIVLSHLYFPTMPENLQTRLHNSLDEILKSSGYIFEIIDQNRKQSNVITSPNNKLIQQSITQLLNGEIQNFHAILDQTVSKLNDAEWCLGVMVEKKLDELKVKEAARKKERGPRGREAKRQRKPRRQRRPKKAEEAKRQKKQQEEEEEAKRRRRPSHKSLITLTTLLALTSTAIPTTRHLVQHGLRGPKIGRQSTCHHRQQLGHEQHA